MTPRTLAAFLALLLLALASTGCSGQEEFLMAVKHHDHAKVQALVKSNPSLVHAQDRYGGGTALNLAVASNDLELVRILLDAGSDPYFCAPTSGTPLQNACGYNRIEIVQELLARKVNVNHQASGRNSSGTPLQNAARGGNVEIVKLLVEHGADVNLLDTTGRMGPPVIAASYLSKHPKEGKQIVLYLLEHGADVNAPVYSYAGGPREGTLEYLRRVNAPGDIMEILKAHGACEKPVITPPAPSITQPASSPSLPPSP